MQRELCHTLHNLPAVPLVLLVAAPHVVAPHVVADVVALYLSVGLL